MKIVVENVSDGEIIPHPVLLIKGRIENLDQDALQLIANSPKESHDGKAKKKKLFFTHRTTNGRADSVSVVGLEADKFKILVRLELGVNDLELEFCRICKAISVTFDPPDLEMQPYRVKLLYIVCSGTDGSFQAPPEVEHDLESALRRISLAGSLIQTFLADSLDAHGLCPTGRKTIHFWSEHPDEGVPDPPVFVVHSRLSLDQAHRMNQEELWLHLGKELVAQHLHESDQGIKFLAITNCTRYVNPKGEVPESYEDTLRLTKGHVALGGGDLGLFGSGCLYTWPEYLDQVQDYFRNEDRVNKQEFMDDSAYRGTLGGCYATTLGTLIHELGHMLGLAHTENGIMARGFDDINRFFTVSVSSPALRPSGQPVRCSWATTNRDATAMSQQPADLQPLNGLTSIRPALKREGSSYLDEYQRKKYYRKMVQDCGGAFWNRSSAIILSYHKWLNCFGEICNESTLSIVDQSRCSDSHFYIKLIEFRDRNGQVLKSIECPAETTNFDLDQEPLFRTCQETFVINSYGQILKI